MSQEPQVQRARPLMFLRGDYMIYRRSKWSQSLSCDLNSDVFGRLIIWHSLECFILSEESLGACLGVPKLQSAQLTTCPAIPLFLLPSELSGTSFSQDPQSHPAINKMGVVSISCTLGKQRITVWDGGLVVHTISLRFPQHQPSGSTHRLCWKPTSQAPHANMDSHNSYPQLHQYRGHLNISIGTEKVVWTKSSSFWNAVFPHPSKAYVLQLCGRMKIQSWGA